MSSAWWIYGTTNTVDKRCLCMCLRQVTVIEFSQQILYNIQYICMSVYYISMSCTSYSTKTMNPFSAEFMSFPLAPPLGQNANLHTECLMNLIF